MRLQNRMSESTIPNDMAANDKRLDSADDSSRKVVIVVAIVAAIVIAAFFYILLRAAGSRGAAEPTLQGALRQGPEFDQYKSRIMLDAPEANEAKRALGDIVMSLQTTVRNFTEKTIDGLEIRGAVVDHQGKAVKERTVIVIPAKQAELAPNKTLGVSIMLEGMSDADDRANIRMEVVGVRFKQ